jgi:hypothetical protein
MKCICNTKTNEVTRVSNERAEEAIKKGGFVFVQKIEWKNAIGTSWNKNNVPANPMSNKKVANKAARYMTPPKANSRGSKERGNR